MVGKKKKKRNEKIEKKQKNMKRENKEAEFIVRINRLIEQSVSIFYTKKRQGIILFSLLLYAVVQYW